MGSTVTLEQKQRWMRERTPRACGVAPAYATSPTERHYTVTEVAEMWTLSDDAVRKMFEREAGVLVIGGVGGRARRYRTLRIPASVLERVHRRLTLP
jgi:hypothetical protein